MATERIRQQRTPTSFGPDATMMSAPDFGASSFSTQGVVDRSKAVGYEGIANVARQAGDLVTGLIGEGQKFNEGMQLADLENQHESLIQEYVNSKQNPHIAGEAAAEVTTFGNLSNSLWDKIGEGATINDLDAVEGQYQASLAKMKKAVNQGVMSTDEFMQRSLAITRSAVNRNPALYDEIIAHGKKVMGLSGMDALLQADKENENNMQKAYQKRVDMAMQISKENDIPLRYDRYGNFDLNYAEKQNEIVQTEKYAASVIARQGALRSATEKEQAGDFVRQFGPQGVNGLLNQTHAQLIGILGSDKSHTDGLNIARQAYQELKQGIAQRAGPLMHMEGVKDVVDYANKQADAHMAMLEKLHTREDQVKYLQNQAALMRSDNYIQLSQMVNPETVQLMAQVMNSQQVGKLLGSIPGQQFLDKYARTLSNVLSGAMNAVGTDYTLKDPSGKNAVAGGVEELLKEATKGDRFSVDGLNNVISTIHADSNGSKFNSTSEKFRFYDDFIKAVGKPDYAKGVGLLSESAVGKATSILQEYLGLTVGNFQKDISGLESRGTRVQVGLLPDGRVNIQTGNPADTDALIQKYSIRINNSLRAYSNLIGVPTKAAAEQLYPQFDALKGLLPQQPTGEGKKEGTKNAEGKPNSSNPLNLTVPGKQGVFQQFNSTEEGIRAASAQLDRYYRGDGVAKTPRKTLNDIAGLWNNENEKGSTSKADYVKTLVKYTGFDPNQELDLNNPSVKADLLQAMSVAEGRPIRPSQIMAALGMR